MAEELLLLGFQFSPREQNNKQTKCVPRNHQSPHISAHKLNFGGHVLPAALVTCCQLSLTAFSIMMALCPVCMCDSNTGQLPCVVSETVLS